MVAIIVITINQHKARGNADDKPTSHIFLILEMIKLDIRFKTQKQCLKVGI